MEPCYHKRTVYVVTRIHSTMTCLVLLCMMFLVLLHKDRELGLYPAPTNTAIQYMTGYSLIPLSPTNVTFLPLRASSKESNTYESIPYDLERTGRTRAASENLSKAETRVRRASDMLPRPQTEENEQEGLSQAMRGSDPQIVQYSIVDKSRKNKEPVPVFEALYDQTSKDDIDTPITS